MTFSFADEARTFDAHIAAHLPGYENVQHLVALVAEHVVPSEGLVVDVGCSSGTTLERLQTRMGKTFRAVGYDIEQDMVDVASQRLRDYANIRIVRADVTQPDALLHGNAHLTLLLWTLQFMEPEKRTDVLRRLRQRSAIDSVLIIAAKTRLSDPRWEEIANAALDEYKEQMGVDAQARVDKTRSLRGFLRVETADDTVERLHRAGWSNPVVLFRWHVWTVLGAFAYPLKPNRIV